MPACTATVIPDRIGTELMDSTPPAITTSWEPHMTAWAAKWAACWEEPHWRSSVTPGISSGRPELMMLVRARLNVWGPIWETQPKITSSTA